MRLLSYQQVKALVPISKSTVKRWVAQGAFPAPIRVNGMTFWSEDNIHAWVKSQAERAIGEIGAPE